VVYAIDRRSAGLFMLELTNGARAGGTR
jgi:hypothetical protein